MPSLSNPLIFCALMLVLAARAYTDIPLKSIRLSCYYYDKTDPHNNSMPFSPGLPSVWAKGLAGENIFLSGKMIDGFINIESLQGKVKSWFGWRVIANYENSDAIARAFCIRGLKEAFPIDFSNKEIIRVAAKTTFLSMKPKPVVFRHHHPLPMRFDKLVIFGDSLSDQGNLYNWLKVFPLKPYFAGRFSNLKVWVDYLSVLSGISVHNFAIGGAVTREFLDIAYDNISIAARLSRCIKTLISGSVKDEIERYNIKVLQGEGIKNADSTLFTIWAGGNDYVSISDLESEVDIFLDDPNDFRIGWKAMVERVTNNILSSVQDLYDLGGRNFLIPTLPDLGKIPRILNNHAYHSQLMEPREIRLLLLSQKMTIVTEKHNERLLEKINQFKANNSDINIILGDVDKGFKYTLDSMDFSGQHFNYDFSDDMSQELSNEDIRLSIHEPCYYGSMFMPDENMVCSESHKAFFWDEMHPTDYVHCLIASYLHGEIANAGGLPHVNLLDYLRMCRPEVVNL